MRKRGGEAVLKLTVREDYTPISLKLVIPFGV
jgi:hypothetical protein